MYPQPLDEEPGPLISAKKNTGLVLALPLYLSVYIVGWPSQSPHTAVDAP